MVFLNLHRIQHTYFIIWFILIQFEEIIYNHNFLLTVLFINFFYQTYIYEQNYLEQYFLLVGTSYELFNLIFYHLFYPIEFIRVQFFILFPNSFFSILVSNRLLIKNHHVGNIFLLHISLYRHFSSLFLIHRMINFFGLQV